MPDQASSIFVDQSETAVATIGSNYLQNFMSGGKVEKGIGVLTQKRFYYKGKNYANVGKSMTSTTEEGMVSIDDIAFTKFTYVRPIGFLIFAVLIAIIAFIPVVIINQGEALLIAAPFWAIALIFVVRYFLGRSTYFVVSFPGGSFGFDIRYYPIADIRDFQRQLHLMKDHLKENG